MPSGLSLIALQESSAVTADGLAFGSTCTRPTELMLAACDWYPLKNDLIEFFQGFRWIRLNPLNYGESEASGAGPEFISTFAHFSSALLAVAGDLELLGKASYTFESFPDVSCTF